MQSFVSPLHGCLPAPTGQAPWTDLGPGWLR